jgi:hypothetical protein
VPAQTVLSVPAGWGAALGNESARAQGDTFAGIRSPGVAPGVVKQLRIEYRINGKSGEATFAENALILLPIPGIVAAAGRSALLPLRSCGEGRGEGAFPAHRRWLRSAKSWLNPPLANRNLRLTDPLGLITRLGSDLEANRKSRVELSAGVNRPIGSLRPPQRIGRCLAGAPRQADRPQRRAAVHLSRFGGLMSLGRPAGGRNHCPASSSGVHYPNESQ